MEKRYQVFVSSTYEDLREERQEVMNALLELDCIPSGMELFPATNASQWDLIKRLIEEADYYILISAGRYGSTGEDGISYTEMEYRYALSINKPIIAFLHKDLGQITSNKTEKLQRGKDKLAAFRTTAQLKMCKFWTTPYDLGGVVSRSLIILMKTTPAIGWVRANNVPDRDTNLELLRLREEVDKLQDELERARKSDPSNSEGYTQGDDPLTVKYTFGFFDSDFESKNDHKDFESTWNEIFSAIAPKMMGRASESELLDQINAFIKKRLNFASPFFRAEIDYQDFQMIKIQLRALGLIEKAKESRISNTPYWTLTPHGDEVMTQLIAIKRPVNSQ